MDDLASGRSGRVCSQKLLAISFAGSVALPFRASNQQRDSKVSRPASFCFWDSHPPPVGNVLTVGKHQFYSASVRWSPYSPLEPNIKIATMTERDTAQNKPLQWKPRRDQDGKSSLSEPGHVRVQSRQYRRAGTHSFVPI